MAGRWCELRAGSSSAESEMLAPEQSNLCRVVPFVSCLSCRVRLAYRPYYRAYLLQKGSRMRALADDPAKDDWRLPHGCIPPSVRNMVVYPSWLCHHGLDASGCGPNGSSPPRPTTWDAPPPSSSKFSSARCLSSVCWASIDPTLSSGNNPGAVEPLSPAFPPL
jgi:hypothetical protein